MLWWLAQNALMAAGLAVLVAVACRLGRFRPAVRHALWLVVLAKLVAPPLLPWSWPAEEPQRDGLVESAAPVAAAEERASSAVTANPAAEFSPQSLHAKWLTLEPRGTASDPIILESRQAAEPAVPTPSDTRPAAFTESPGPALPAGAWLSGPAAELFFYLWLGAVGAMAGLQLTRMIRFRRLLTTGRAAPHSLTDLVAELAARLRVRPPATVVVPGLGSPMVWGLGRPILLWPASLLGRLSLNCKRAVLVHELAHLRRRDHWVGWLQLMVGCVWWWNPVFRFINNQVRCNAELACDAWVIQTLPAARRDYAEALLEVSQLTSRSAPPLPALGMAGGHPDFERRLIMIMRDRVPCRVPMLGFALIGLLALVAVPGWSLSQQPAEGKPKVKEVEKKTEKKPIETILEGVSDSDVGSIDVELVQAGKGGSDSDRLDRLEKQLEALLKEVKALRGGAGKPAGKEVTVEVKPGGKLAAGEVRFNNKSAVKDQGTVEKSIETRVWAIQGEGEHAVTLTRSTYKMPKDKAEALAKFLSDQVKGQVLETKVEGEGIVVTTTPHIQRTIHDFINLVQGSKQTFHDFNKDGELELRYDAAPIGK